MIGIGYLIDDLGTGGAQRQLVELVTRLDRNNFAPRVYYYADPPFYADALKAADVPAVRIHKRRGFDIRVTLAMLRAARRHSLALLHGYLAGPNLYTAGAARMLPGLKAVASERSNQPERPVWLSTLEAGGYHGSHAIIANTISAANRLIADYRLSPKKVYTVHNGVDVERFAYGARLRDATRHEYDIKPDERMLLLVGRPSPEKNHLQLINAFGQARSRMKRRWKLFLVGGELRGDYGKTIERAIASHGLGDHIRVLPPTGEIERFLAACDVLALPSLFEGCPNVVMEAASAGRPVIASRVSDMHLLVKDGQSGWLFDPSDLAQLTALLLELDDASTEALQSMGQVGAELMRREFSMDAMVTRTVEIYQRVLSN